MRLIDADLMVELIKAQITANEDDKSTAGMAAKRVMGRLIEFVNDLPTAQPEIIRCKDCRMYGDAECLMNFDGYDWAEPEGYCHAAERKAKKWMTL